MSTTAGVRYVPLEAFEALYQAYVATLQAGRFRIIEAGGQCDEVRVMEFADPALIKARQVIYAAKVLGNGK